MRVISELLCKRSSFELQKVTFWRVIDAFLRAERWPFVFPKAAFGPVEGRQWCPDELFPGWLSVCFEISDEGF